MKNIISLLVLGLIMMGSTGCIGPVSGWNLERIREQKLQRSIQSSNMPQEQKQKLFYAMAVKPRENEVAFGAGVDLLALMGTEYSWSEVGSQALAVGGEMAAYYFAGRALLDAVKDDDSQPASSPAGTTAPDVSGDGNNITIINNYGTFDGQGADNSITGE